MDSTTPTPAPGATDDPRLADVVALQARGLLDEAARLAERAFAAGDLPPLTQCRLQLRLARGDLARARPVGALRVARRALQLARQAESVPDEVDALLVQSRAATRLARHAEAVEAALLARALKDATDAERAAQACAILSQACGWARLFERSRRAFDEARPLLANHATPDVHGKALLQQLWIRALRATLDRSPADSPSDLQRLQVQLTELAAQHPMPQALARAADIAVALANRGTAAVPPMPAHDPLSPFKSWLPATHAWLQAEQALAAGQLDSAALHASRMSAWAAETAHVPLAMAGHQLAAEVFQRQGQPALALEEWRKQVAFERDAAVRHLDDLADQIGAEMHTFGSLRLQAVRSRQFEQWAFEDALTGLPNLRRFNQRLDDWTAAAADAHQTLSVALIDVDRFKSINDGFSHEVGDQVLRVVAQKMRQQVRDEDLPARWGGDEFAVLFRDTDLSRAEQVALRIQQAVQLHDWARIAPQLAAGISVGVVEVRRGDDKQSILKRVDAAMYAQKAARRQAELEQAIPLRVLQAVAGWLRQARRVVVFVGAGVVDGRHDGQAFGPLSGWSADDRQAYAHRDSWLARPRQVQAYWSEWRRAHAASPPEPLLQAVVALGHALPQVVYVTERIDNALARAGAHNVIELYGQAFRDRCAACGTVQPTRDDGHCLACRAVGPTIRPDVVLLGEHPDERLLAAAELAFKRADVVLVIACDASTHPGAGLLDKARVRNARVVMLGTGPRTQRGLAVVSIAAAPLTAVNRLHQVLQDGFEPDVVGPALSDAGLAICCFLSGQGTDSDGLSIEQVLALQDSQLGRHGRSMPWLFPLPTRSRANPDAPTPSTSDFVLLARDAQSRQGLLAAWSRLLRFYGFELQHDKVVKRADWRVGFSIWAPVATQHDFFISRMLGALRLCGLQPEASRFLQALEDELPAHRGSGAEAALQHWRLAAHGEA